MAAATYGTNNMVFLTVTAGALDELQELLDRSPAGSERVDVSCRSFHGISEQVWKDLCEGFYLPESCRVKADYGTKSAEFQARGKPHTHKIAHFPGRAFTAHEVCNLHLAAAQTLTLGIVSCRLICSAIAPDCAIRDVACLLPTMNRSLT